MSIVDVVIVLLVAGAAVHGLLLGAAIQALSFGGTAAGLALGATLAPTITKLGSDPFAKAIIGLATVFGLAALLGALGRQLGVRVWGHLRRAGLAAIDAGAGAFAAAASTLLGVWLIGSMLAAVPARPISNALQRSAILRELDRALPPAPSVFARLQRILDSHGFPLVFAELEPDPATRLPLPTDPDIRAAVTKAGPSTVKVVGLGCGGVLSGSGFVAAPGLVITNAHVVAGIRHPTVVTRNGTRAATAALFDPNLDIAVLRVSGISAAPLNLVSGSVPRGTKSVVLGYPLGGPFDAEPAVVLARIVAVGRNIYSSRVTTRVVYEVESKVRPGNSGGPLVLPNGSVAGVVFSRSTRNNDIGFTLTSEDAAQKLAAAQRQTSVVSTGACAAE